MRPSLATSIIDHWNFVGTLSWDRDLCNPRWSDRLRSSIPPYKGVYCFIDSDGRIQKVGKTEQKEGLRGRLWFSRGDPVKDPTTCLWESVWNRGAMAGRDIRVYFHPTPPIPQVQVIPGVGDFEVLLEWARDLERQLSRRAREEGEPMLLAGAGD